MKIKVCGMKYPENIEGVSALQIDFMGFIFYEKSPRFVGDLPLCGLQNLRNNSLKKVGVFVDSNMDFIKKKSVDFSLDFIQLHGNESPEFCEKIKAETGLPIIKAFGIENENDFENTKKYAQTCEYFLFDTKSAKHGGSGEKFAWDILNKYTGETAFFLSGGISADDAKTLKTIKHSKLFAIDLNSKFESESAVKNIPLLKRFLKEIQS